MQCGAMGYLTKNSPAAELFKAVVEIFNNRKFICSDINDQLSASLLEEGSPPIQRKPLTAGEIEIIGHIKKGSGPRFAKIFQLPALLSQVPFQPFFDMG